MTELLPCPFCGGEAEIRGSILLFVQCAKCKTRYGDGYHATKADATAAWNTRADRTCEVEARESAWGERHSWRELENSDQYIAAAHAFDTTNHNTCFERGE